MRLTSHCLAPLLVSGVNGARRSAPQILSVPKAALLSPLADARVVLQAEAGRRDLIMSQLAARR